jgi:hypothetical protein
MRQLETVVGDTEFMEVNATETRICGGCRWVKGPRRWTLRRLQDAAEDGLTPLLRELDALRRQKYWCSRENCWTHLLDDACSLWQPAEDPMVD